MKQILFIELCNFKDYPLGGHLSFALHLTSAMRGDLDLVGTSTDANVDIGRWTTISISGFSYNFYNVRNVHKDFKKPIIPGRMTSFVVLKRHIMNILMHKNYDIIIVQTPEVLFTIPKHFLPRICLIMPGVENPLTLSRYSWARKFAPIFDKYFFKRAAKVKNILPAADSNAIDSFIKRGCGCINPECVRQFPTRYDADIFYPKSKADVRSKLGIQSCELMLVTTGRLNWYKGWKFMIDAFEIFLTTHKKAKLYFVGKGEDELKIRSYILERGLCNSVILAGVHPLPVVADYLNAADLFIMGSYYEGWSTSLVEAVACSLPCVTTNFSSAHDLIKNGKNGYVIDNRDESDFAESLEKALNLNGTVVRKFAESAYKMSVQTMREELNVILQFE